MINDPDFMREWVAELRSGKHQQKFGSLGNFTSEDSPVCALGVGSRILHRRRSAESIFSYVDGKDVATIICMNDGEYKPFDYIATHIEQNIIT